MAESLTGTPRGATRCGECGHMRQRHLVAGTGPCADVRWTATKPGYPMAPARPRPCSCPMFTEPKGN